MKQEGVEEMEEFWYVLVPCDIHIDPRNDSEGFIQITFPDAPGKVSAYVGKKALILTNQPAQNNDHFQNRGYVKSQVWEDLGDRVAVRIPGETVASGSIIELPKDYVKEVRTWCILNI